MKQIQKVSVCGLGKLGACIAATMAARGFEVLGVDIDPEKVRRVNDGLPPVEEPLLAETIVAGKGRLRATVDHREAVRTDVSFFIPPSPSLPDGSFSTEFLLRTMQPIATAVQKILCMKGKSFNVGEEEGLAFNTTRGSGSPLLTTIFCRIDQSP